MTDTILVINAGSSSVKFCLYALTNELPLLGQGKVSDLGNKPVLSAADDKGVASEKALAVGTSHEESLRAILDWVQGHKDGWSIKASAHRIAHGGTEFTAPIRVTSDIFHRLKKLCSLAPLHQPHNLMALGIVDRLLPHVPQIACFDTAFHSRHDPLFSVYALPEELTDKGIRHYGFHGLSYEWIAHTLRDKHPVLAKGRVVAAHLGNGASLCAMKNGISIDTTMGMTALDGVPMGTRSGSIDPGAIIYMIRDLGMPVDDVEHILYEKSGLRGLSGQTNDVKALLSSSEPKAKFALDYFALKVAQYMAMMAVAIGGIDGIVFTGGIGENAAPIREAILNYLAFMGSGQTLVIPANEEKIMAMHAANILSS